MNILESLKSSAGIVEKAVLEVADFSENKLEKTDVPAPEKNKAKVAGAKDNLTKAKDTANKAKKKAEKVKSKINLKAVKNYAKAPSKIAGIPGNAANALNDADGEDEQDRIEGHEKYKSYRFHCQFNPEEITIFGYAGDTLATLDYQEHEKNTGDDGNKQDDVKMAPANAHIEMNFKLIFDKSVNSDAFYSDKFTLSFSNLGKAVASSVAKGVFKKTYSVQREVEALTAIVRDSKKNLAAFYWGDMCYQGVINNISAEYVMFNVSCEPIRAYVTVNMVLLDEKTDMANSDLWVQEYMNDIHAIQEGANAEDVVNAAKEATEAVDPKKKENENIKKMVDKIGEIAKQVQT